jgi:CheY-like chemotaxis protein
MRIDAPDRREMNDQLSLVLAVTDLAYSGGEFFDLLQSCLDRAALKVNLEAVPFAKVVETARRRNPNLIIIGHRPLPDTDVLECWKTAGSPMGGDIVRALKSDVDTQDIPVLMLEGLRKADLALKGDDASVETSVSHLLPKGWPITTLPFGVDAYLEMPFDPKEFLDTVKPLIASRSC